MQGMRHWMRFTSNCNGQYSPQRGLHQNYSPSVVPPCVGPSSANLVLSKLAGLTAAALRLGHLSNRSGTCDTQQQAQAEAYSPAVVGIAVALVEAGLAHAGPGGGPADVVAARVGGGAAVGAVRVLAAGLAGKLAWRDLAVPQACEAREVRWACHKCWFREGDSLYKPRVGSTSMRSAWQAQWYHRALGGRCTAHSGGGRRTRCT